MKKEFGISVKALRNQLGLSQEKLAERANLHRTYVSDVERGARNVSLQNIGKIAGALEVSVAALFPQSIKIETARVRKTAASEPVEILLVEDNCDDVVLTLQAFKMARFTNYIQVVTDGAEALDYIFGEGNYANRKTKRGPQVILLDLNLPKVSGLEVLRRLKANPRTALIPVVVLTGSKNNHDMVECRQLGVATYLVKPVDFQRLSLATPQLNLNWTLFKPTPSHVQNARM